MCYQNDNWHSATCANDGGKEHVSHIHGYMSSQIPMWRHWFNKQANQPSRRKSNTNGTCIPLAPSGLRACLDDWPVLKRAKCIAAGAEEQNAAHFWPFLNRPLRRHCLRRILLLGILGSSGSSISGYYQLLSKQNQKLFQIVLINVRAPQVAIPTGN